jgi:undecaprenyl-diphosphatase
LIAVVGTALAPPWLAIALWVWAPLVSLARVAMGVHYLSDIVAGGILGSIVGLVGLQIYPPMVTWLEGVIGFALW